MNPGALGAQFKDRPSPFDRFDEETDALVGNGQIPLALRYFGGAGLAHMQEFGTELATFAKIRAKASRHAANNPLALFRTVVTEEEVLHSPVLWPGVMTRLMACPPTCGAAAAVLCSADYAARHGLRRDVRIRAQAMTTDTPVTFGAHDMREVVGYSMARAAATQVYEAAGIGPRDLDVVELHDCFAQNELITYEALGLCPRGAAERFVCDGDNTYGGAVRRPAVEGTPARRDRARAVHRTRRAAARRGRIAPGGRCAPRASAQSRSRRRVRGHALRARLSGRRDRPQAVCA
jgi:acetyl-CoA acetyltransferase